MVLSETFYGDLEWRWVGEPEHADVEERSMSEIFLISSQEGCRGRVFVWAPFGAFRRGVSWILGRICYSQINPKSDGWKSQGGG